jgi:hypothetical protein
MADVTKAIEPRSDQMNAEDLLGGPRTFTITRVVVRDSPEQPISVWFAEFPQGRPWKPAKTMSKLMALAWTAESDRWVGHRVTLYCDPDVKFGPAVMGGIRISHMSGIGPKPLSANLATTRGKRAPYTALPIPDGVPAPNAPGLMDQLVWAFNAAKVEKEARLDYCRGIVQRPLKTAHDLSADEVAVVIASLAARDGHRPDPVQGLMKPHPGVVQERGTADPTGEPTDEELADAFEREQMLAQEANPDA